jgi:hypothetical protein
MGKQEGRIQKDKTIDRRIGPLDNCSEMVEEREDEMKVSDGVREAAQERRLLGLRVSVDEPHRHPGASSSQ